MNHSADGIIQTPYGVFAGVTATQSDADGMLTGLYLGEKNMLVTHAGELIPAYGEITARRRQKPSVTFHTNGMIKSVALEACQEIQTPIGELPCERVTFYETGEIRRVFPMDGQISGFWSESDEKALGIPLSFKFDFTEFTAYISAVSFYRDGSIRSITLFGDEKIQLKTRFGAHTVRHGFSLYEEGGLRTFEPAVPTVFKTPIGSIAAYDPNANGINADSGSVMLDKLGELEGLCTVSQKIAVVSGGETQFIAPAVTPLPMDAGTALTPLSLRFDTRANCVTLTSDISCTVPLEGSVFTILPFAGDTGGCDPSACAGCSICKH